MIPNEICYPLSEEEDIMKTRYVVPLFAVILTVCFALTGFAQKVKDQSSALDQLVYSSPSLRVVETPVEAALIKNDLRNFAAIEDFRTKYGSNWNVVVDQRRGVIAVLDGG